MGLDLAGWPLRVLIGLQRSGTGLRRDGQWRLTSLQSHRTPPLPITLPGSATSLDALTQQPCWAHCACQCDLMADASPSTQTVGGGQEGEREAAALAGQIAQTNMYSEQALGVDHER